MRLEAIEHTHPWDNFIESTPILDVRVAKGNLSSSCHAFVLYLDPNDYEALRDHPDVNYYIKYSTPYEHQLPHLFGVDLIVKSNCSFLVALERY